MPGPKCATQRAKTSKRLRGNNKEKRFKVDNEKQQAYKEKRAKRKDKESKRKARRAKG
jgi:hypothetical protein